MMGSLFSEHTTWLHPVRASLKLVAIGVLSSALFLLHQPWAMGACAAAALLLWLSLGAARRVAHRLLVSVVIAAVLIAAFHSWLGNYSLAATTALRLWCTCVLGIALTVTTRPQHILEALERGLQPLQRLGIPTQRFALQLALMLRFIEHFFVQWKTLDDAYRLRTGRSGGYRLLAPLCIQMLQTARRVGDALFARLGQ